MIKRTFLVYPDTSGKWRWKLIAKSNGKIVSNSAESFDSAGNAMRAAKREASHYADGASQVLRQEFDPALRPR